MALRRLGRPLGRALVMGAFTGSVASCSDCDDEAKAAEVFVEANRQCRVDADCVAVRIGCAKFSRSSCGQALLSRAAAASPTWQALQRDLRECEDSCTVCLDLLAPSCSEGLCGGR